MTIKCVECGNEIGPTVHLCPRSDPLRKIDLEAALKNGRLVPLKSEAHEKLRKIAVRVADGWRIDRQNPYLLDSMNYALCDALEALDEFLLGAVDRCQCMSWRMGGARHDEDCPSRRPDLEWTENSPTSEGWWWRRYKDKKVGLAPAPVYVKRFQNGDLFVDGSTPVGPHTTKFEWSTIPIVVPF